MKQFYYSNNKLTDYTLEFCKKLKKNKVEYVICDFPEQIKNKTFCFKLHGVGLKVFFSIKMYYKLTKEELFEKIKKAKNYDFDGLAIDCEAYNNSNVWIDNNYINFIPEILNYFKELIIYPENLGGEKYKNYENFLLTLNERICKEQKNVYLLTEKTYEMWKPWTIFIYYFKQKYKYKNISIVAGIWQDSMADFKFISIPLINKIEQKIEKDEKKGLQKYLKFYEFFEKNLFLRKIISFPVRLIQDLETRILKYRFYYTEEKNI